MDQVTGTIRQLLERFDDNTMLELDGFIDLFLELERRDNGAQVYWDGWEPTPDGGYVHFFTDQPMDFSNAKRYCQEIQAQPLVIKSSEVNEWLKSRLGDAKIWMDRQQLDQLGGDSFINWAEGEENRKIEANAVKACPLISSDGFWRRADCYFEQHVAGCMLK